MGLAAQVDPGLVVRILYALEAVVATNNGQLNGDQPSCLKRHVVLKFEQNVREPPRAGKTFRF